VLGSSYIRCTDFALNIIHITLHKAVHL